MSLRELRFFWSDSWLFLAMGLKARDKPASLPAIIALADAIQHAIPTKDEVDGAIGRLQRAGLIRYASDGVSLLPAGSELISKVREAAGKASDIEVRLAAALQAEPWTPNYRPSMARYGEPDIMPMNVWETAMSRYRTA